MTHATKTLKIKMESKCCSEGLHSLIPILGGEVLECEDCGVKIDPKWDTHIVPLEVHEEELELETGECADEYEALRLRLEDRITDLNETIRDRDVEIANLIDEANFADVINKNETEK